MTGRPFAAGDPVEVRFVTQDGNVIWNRGRVIRRTIDCLVVQMAGGYRKEIEHGRGLYRSPLREEAP